LERSGPKKPVAWGAIKACSKNSSNGRRHTAVILCRAGGVAAEKCPFPVSWRPSAFRRKHGAGRHRDEWLVLWHDGNPSTEALGRDLVSICRARCPALVVAGDARLAAALGAGMHLRSGRWPNVRRPSQRLIASSAHRLPDLLRARRAGAALPFLLPTFAPASHPDVTALGPVRREHLAGSAGLPVAALGGITGTSIRRLPARICHAVEAIGALV
jgi:thiamine-phosphate pyrophosphorylase